MEDGVPWTTHGNGVLRIDENATNDNGEELFANIIPRENEPLWRNGFLLCMGIASEIHFAHEVTKSPIKNDGEFNAIDE